MGHEEVGGTLDILSERRLEVFPQTCSHSLQKSSPLGYHEAVLFSDVPVVPWRVEFPSAEQPVYVLQSVK